MTGWCIDRWIGSTARPEPGAQRPRWSPESRFAPCANPQESWDIPVSGLQPPEAWEECALLKSSRELLPGIAGGNCRQKLHVWHWSLFCVFPLCVVCFRSAVAGSISAGFLPWYTSALESPLEPVIDRICVHKVTPCFNSLKLTYETEPKVYTIYPIIVKYNRT